MCSIQLSETSEFYENSLPQDKVVRIVSLHGSLAICLKRRSLARRRGKELRPTFALPGRALVTGMRGRTCDVTWPASSPQRAALECWSETGTRLCRSHGKLALGGSRTWCCWRTWLRSGWAAATRELRGDIRPLPGPRCDFNLENTFLVPKIILIGGFYRGDLIMPWSIHSCLLQLSKMGEISLRFFLLIASISQNCVTF